MPRQHTTEPFSSRRHVRLAAFAVGALVLVLTFATNFDGAFVLDDRVNLTDNPSVTQFDPTSLGNWVAAAFESPARLRPIPYLTFAWQWYLFGGSPAALHFLSDLFHALAAVALFFLLLEFFGLHAVSLLSPSPPAPLPIKGRGAPETARKIPSPNLSGSPLPVIGRGVGREGKREQILLAATGALLWALHPVQTSAVTYLVQRMAVLSGLFQLVALWLYLRGRRTGEGRNYALAALAYLCALFSKESAAALPVIVLAYEWLLGPTEEKPVRFRRIGLLLLACVPPILMAAAYGMMDPSKHFATGTMPGRDFTLAERLLSAPRMYFRYLKLLALPWPQALDYGLAASKGLFSSWTTLASWIAGLAVLALAILKRKSHPVTAFLILTFFLALAPESTFLNLELFFEHRLYLASAALLPLVPVGIWRLRIHEKFPGQIAHGVLAGLLCAAAVFTGVRNREWKSEVGLLEQNVYQFPGNVRALTSLGGAYALAGRLDDAITIQGKAVRMQPDYTAARYNLGDVLGQRGRLEEAETQFRKVLETNPEFERLVTGFLNLGDSWQARGNSDRAVAAYEEALRLDPARYDVRAQLGAVLLNKGAYERALSYLKTAAESDPYNAKTHYNLGVAYLHAGDGASAYRHFHRSCDLGLPQACAQVSGER